MEPVHHSNFTNRQLDRPGIYRVTYIPDGDIYVGCSHRLNKRIARYTRKHWTSPGGPWMERKALRLMGYKDPLPKFGVHIDPSWYIYIRQNLEVHILEFTTYCSRSELESIEQKWIKQLNPQMNAREASIIVSRNPWIEIRLSELEAAK